MACPRHTISQSNHASEVTSIAPLNVIKSSAQTPSSSPESSPHYRIQRGAAESCEADLVRKSRNMNYLFLFFVFHNLQSTLKQELNDKNKYLQYILINNNLLTYLS